MNSRKLTVLILEDSPADAALIEDTLREADFEFTTIQTGEVGELDRLIEKVAPDLIFADRELAGDSAFKAIAAAQQRAPATPFIFISETPGEELAVEAVRSGATDYVLKDRITRLGPAVRRALHERQQLTAVDADRSVSSDWVERPGDSRRLCELNRLVRATREINKVVVRERDPEKLLTEACNILVRTRGYLHAGIGLVASRFLRIPPVTRPACGYEFLDSLTITWSGDAAELVPAHATIHSGRSWVCRDTANDPRFAVWREAALACGCASLATVPMMHWGQVIGALTLCSDRTETFQPEELRLLEELAEDLAHALECIRRDQAYHRAEAHLHLLKSALRSAANAIVITDRDGLVYWVNPAFTVLTGYSFEEMKRSRTNMLKSGIHDEQFFHELWSTIQAGKAWHSEIVNRRKDGTIYTEECTITPVRNDHGDISHFIAVKQDVSARKQAEELMRSNLERLLRHESALTMVTKDMSLPAGDLAACLRRLTETAARAIGVARVSFWRYDSGGESLRCIDLFELDKNRHSEGARLMSVDYPAYFRALAESEVVAADDARVEPRTAEFSSDYLVPNGIVSMMDVPVRLKGKLDGVICHEHVGSKRSWTSDERTFAIAIANLAALVLEEDERKRAQEQLRHSELAYASLVNTVDGIVWELDVPTFRFTFVSEQAERLLGYPVAHWLQEPGFWQSRLHPEDRNTAVSYCQTATAEMRDHDFEYRMIAADGRVVWIRDIVTVVVENNRPAKLRGIMVDISQQKQTEADLRWRTAFFEALVDSNLDGLLVVDHEGRKILQNRRMMELWGIPAEIANDPDDRRQVEFVKNLTRNSEQFTAEVARLYAHHDEVHRCEIELINGTVLDRYSAPVRDAHGTYYGRIWAFRDMTERRQLEAQFRQAQKMEAIGQLAGGVAHDFNNILTAVMMHLGILRTTLKEPGTAEALKELESQARRASELTRQLLMFSRKSAIELKPLDLNATIAETQNMLSRLLGEHIRLDFHASPCLPLVEGDRGMIQQVIMNLALNGRDAMPGGGRLEMGAEVCRFDAATLQRPSDRRAGTFVRLSVSDSGCGMDEATRRRIFEPFFTTKPQGKGTGLGLATVYGIVQQHRGWIEVESEPGKGSTFHVFLPATNRTESAGTGEPAPTLRGGNETILLVEDESRVRLATARRLQMLGYRVIEATDGKMAMHLWIQHARHVHLLLTDMIMPNGLSGLELAREFRKDRPDLKVIITSGYNVEVEKPAASSEPDIVYLPKPFEALHLANTVRSCLDLT